MKFISITAARTRFLGACAVDLWRTCLLKNPAPLRFFPAARGAAPRARFALKKRACFGSFANAAALSGSKTVRVPITVCLRPPETVSEAKNKEMNAMPAIGFVTKQPTGGYKGQLKTLTIRADIEVVPNPAKTSDTQPDFRVTSGGVDIGAGWIRKGETSGKDYVSLSLAAPEFGPRKLYANLGRAPGDNSDLFAVIWNPAD